MTFRPILLATLLAVLLAAYLTSADVKCIQEDKECGGFRPSPAPACCSNLTCRGDLMASDGPGLCKPNKSTCSTIKKRCRKNDMTLDCCSGLTCKTPKDTTFGECQK